MSKKKSHNELWEKTILPLSATIQQAINSMNESSSQIVIAVSDQNIFLGTLTDGDIRRRLLDGIELNSSISSLIHRKSLVVSPHISRERVLQLMISNKIKQIPIVNDQKKVVGLHLWDTINAPPVRENLMVIMAGGLGKRLRPYTDNCPKPLLSIGGKPMLEHIIERAKLEGINNFVIAINYLGHMIEEYFQNGDNWQVRIDYLYEKSSLGTAGALGLLNPWPEIPFLVTNGDILTEVRYGGLLDFHIHHNAIATMAVSVYGWQHPFGVVQTRGIDIIGLEEKPVTRSYINAGIYTFSPNALSVLDTNIYCDMPYMFEQLRKTGNRIVAYPMHEPWLDIGRPDDFAAAQLKSPKNLVGIE